MRTFAPSIVRLSLACCWLLGGCSVMTASPSPGESSPTLELTGSSTIAPLMSEIGKRFEARHPRVRVNVQMGGTSRGIADVRTGMTQIGMVSRALYAEESDLQATTIALDGVCLIVHADNPVTELARDEVISIYTGAIDNWKGWGGDDAPITVVNKAQGRSTLEVFSDYFRLSSESIRPDIVIGDNEQGVKTVANDPHAIGYVSIGTAQYHRAAGTRIKLLPIDGVEPSVDAVARGEFPIVRELNLVTVGTPDDLTRELIELARSPEVTGLIREFAFVPTQP